MPPPILNQAQTDQLTIERDRQANVSQTLADQIPAKTTRQAELVLADSGFQLFFDYFNDDIIAQYDAERAALDGIFIPLPIIEQDIIDLANTTGRLTPTPSATAPLRIPEFDGGNTSVNPLNETQHLINTEQLANIFQNGYGSGTATSALTTSALLPSSTLLSVTNLLAETIQPGDFYILEDGLDLAVIEIITATDGGGADPPFLTDLTLSVIVPPTLQVGLSANFVVFTGFTDGERSAKAANNAALQPLMDSLVSDLENELNGRITTLDFQDTAINANQDDDGIAELVTALALNSTARLFIQNYLIGTDVSDAGLLILTDEKTTRDAEITTRVAQILANYTGQTLNYYDERFNHATNRGDLLNGSLRQSVLIGQSLQTSADYAASAQSVVGSINNILP